MDANDKIKMIDKVSGPFKKRPIILAILISLSVISFYTSFDGVSKLVFGDNPITFGTTTFFLFFVVFTIQGILLYALLMLIYIGFSLIRGLLLWFLIYIITMSVSVFFSYSFYYTLFRADDFAKENFMSQVREVRRDFQTFQTQFDNVFKAVMYLARYSTDMAKKEDKLGGTCGYNAGTNKGPRWQFRTNEAELFNSFVPDIDNLKKKINQDISMIDGKIKDYTAEDDIPELEEEINDRISRVNRYIDESILEEIQTAVKAHTGNKRYGIFSYSPITKKLEQIDCPDGTFDSKANSIINSRKQLQKIDEVTLFDPKEDRQRFARAFSVFSAFPLILTGTKQLDSPKSNEPNAITKRDLTPLVIGIFVDIFIFLVGLADGIKEKYLPKPIDKATEGLYFDAPNLKALIEFYNKHQGFEGMRHLLEYLYEDGLFKSKFFIVPILYNDSSTVQEIVELFRTLEANRQIKLFAGNVPYKILPKSMKKRLDERLDEHSQVSFNVYRMPKRAWNELHLAATYVSLNK